MQDTCDCFGIKRYQKRSNGIGDKFMHSAAYANEVNKCSDYTAEHRCRYTVKLDLKETLKTEGAYNTAQKPDQKVVHDVPPSRRIAAE